MIYYKKIMNIDSERNEVMTNDQFIEKEESREKKKKKEVLQILLLILIIIILGMIAVFVFMRMNVQLELLEYDTSWTNQSISLTVKKVNHALYSFNKEKYSASNTYEIDQNVKNLSIRMKVYGKEYKKEITISNIDKEPPIINGAFIKGNILQVDAVDTLSDIKEYIYTVDGKEHVSKDNTFQLERDTKDIEIQVIDHAGNCTTLPKSYFENDDLTYTLSTESWTNQNITLTVLKKSNYLEYSLSYDSERTEYQKENSFEITKNGTVYLSVKTNSQELKKEIEIKNIDREKPKASFKIQNGVVKITATDNSNDTLLYSWNGGKYGSTLEKSYQKDAKNQIVRVKDCAGNITAITFDVVISKATPTGNNKNPNHPKPTEKTPTPTSPTKPTSTGTKNPTPTPTNAKPTFEIQYSETGPTTNPVTITVVTDASNLISFQGGAWTSNKSIVISSNVNNYKIQVKNKAGAISETTINITNIVKEKTTREKNQDMISQIQNTYGFNISYGDGTYCYYAGGSCTPLYDEEKANKALTKITNLLKNFPTDFFRKFQGNNGYRMILFDDIPGNTQGVTSYEIGNDNQLFLDVNNDLLLERVIYHETWHFMEQLIMIKNNYNNPFDNNWDQLNPAGFTYPGDSSNTYTPYDANRYNPGYPIQNMAFISVYGKTNGREDRAEIFADLMFRGYKQNYMQAGYGINEKAKVMMQEVRKIWTNSPSAAWEKYITW